jgi:AbrB family looped-hinge helix DNA binding protein
MNNHSDKWHKDDAGRTANPRREKRDCTVRALAVCSGKTYDECLDIMASVGRKKNKGIPFVMVAQQVASLAGIKLKQVKRSGTLTSFLRKFPQGTYYVTIRGHAMAIKDGIVHDLVKPKPYCMIRKAWRVEKLVKPQRVIPKFPASLCVPLSIRGEVAPSIRNTALRVTFSTKGQIVIPKVLRKKLKLNAGSRCVVQVRENGIELIPVDDQPTPHHTLELYEWEDGMWAKVWRANPPQTLV